MALVVLCAALVAGMALRDAQQLALRGREIDFPKPVRGAEALLLGTNVVWDSLDSGQAEAQSSLLQTNQITYVRQEFRWSDIEAKAGSYEWASSDRVFELAQRHHQRILAVLTTTPMWARISAGAGAITPTATAPPQHIEDFARFASEFAKRYDRFGTTAISETSPIMGYQIWDEPNLSIGWGESLIDPPGYLRLLWAGGDAIRAISPKARIVLAGLAPTVETSEVNLAPHLFLRQLYRLGGHDAFDVAAAKPYGFELHPEDRRVDPNTLNFSHILLMREEMVAHGEDEKAIWATEFGWNALPPNWSGEPSIWGNVSEQQQAEWTLLAVQRAAREWPWLGAMFVDTLTPFPREMEAEADPAWGFAMLSQHNEPRPVFAAFAQAQRESALAMRGQAAALCRLPTRLIKVIDSLNLQPQNKRDALDTLPDIEGCYQPNPEAEFIGGWRFGRQGADVPQVDGAKVRIRFSGDAFALTLRRAGIEYRAYAFVTIDGQPANLLPQEPRGAYVVMNSPDLQPHVETIPVATGLSPGEHVAEVIIDGGWNLWALVGWSSRYSVNPTGWQFGGMAAWAVALLGLIGLLYAAPKAQWGALWQTWQPKLAPAIRASHAFGLALLMWLAASLTWAQDAATAWRNLPIVPSIVTALTSALAFWAPLYVLGLIALAALFGLVLLRLDLGLMLLAFFVPFYLLPQRLFARSFSMVELLTVMCFVSWLWQMLRGWFKAGKPIQLRATVKQFSLLDWSVLLLVIASVLSASQADFQVEAFRELRTVIVESAAVYLMLRAGPPHLPSSWRAQMRWRVLDGFVAGATGVALIGLVNYVRGDRFAAEFGLPRIKSVFGSANNDALLFERVLPLLVAVFVWMLANARSMIRVGQRQKPSEGFKRFSSTFAIPARFLLYSAAVLPVFVALLLTQSRGALLFGLPALFITVLWLNGRRSRGVALVGLGLIGLGLVALFTGAALPLVQGTRLANAFDLQRGTGFFRLNLWVSAWRMWLDHFWLGVGPDNFLYAYRSFYILPVAWKEPNLSHPHNVLFEFATRLGLPGVIAGAGLITGFIRNIALGLHRKDEWRPVYIGAAGMLAAMLAHGLVDQSFFLIELAFPFMVLAGVCSVETDK